MTRPPGETADAYTAMTAYQRTRVAAEADKARLSMDPHTVVLTLDLLDVLATLKEIEAERDELKTERDELKVECERLRGAAANAGLEYLVGDGLVRAQLMVTERTPGAVEILSKRCDAWRAAAVRTIELLGVAVHHPRTTATGPTRKIRIAVAVEPNGAWNSYGFAGAATDKPGEDALLYESEEEKRRMALDPCGEGAVVYWLEAEVPLPQETVIKAAVIPEGT